ncbi:peptidoglycan D,D-transpeptidase FtsI family protein [Candidatus Pelagibacter communis]|uniref:peptidoglycan D,D-transpeptidase FtsI family protein n=1 Tax=Pelagibacter ubique TaxID=198252 RepID=UPI00094D706B|nr:penicillin-binding protein 2 [Candidatus Pelagibacter ubique]|tara:strand:+ start:1242 stop:2927 length:1686 start_codon:yes stop_codon:yes gene_type:complete
MNNKDRFILYNKDDEFDYKKNKSKIDIRFNRISFIFFVFFVISIIYSIHLVHLGTRKSDDSKKDQKNYLNNLKRADIIDRNGDFLAKTVSSIDIGINPTEIIDQKKLLLNLGYIFPNKNYELIKSKINKNKFFWFEKKISEDNYEKIMMLGDKSIKPEEKLTRIYPQKNLFSHIIGQIDDDNNGISGLEKSLDERLKKNKNEISLTVDKDIQFLIREELIKFNNIFRTKGSAAILMDVKNGEILSLLSLPDFDPNARERIENVNFINRATKGVYELGSVFKTFTLAAGIHEGLIEPDTKFINLEKSIKCGKNIITEYDKNIPSNLTAEEILIRSGNIGSVRIGQSVGIEKFKEFLEDLDLINTIQFDIQEMGVPLSFNWGKCKLATASYGHGITTTILQLANAYSIIANGGYKINPTLVKKDNLNLNNERILKNDVSKKINSILRKIVTTKEGTASLANIEGYEVGGKTGTAQKSALGGYSNYKINTFASVFPISDPKYTLVVMLDEPKTNSEYIYHYRDGTGIKYQGTPFNTAGWTTVEVVGQIIEKIGPILATKYNEIY